MTHRQVARPARKHPDELLEATAWACRFPGSVCPPVGLSGGQICLSHAHLHLHPIIPNKHSSSHPMLLPCLFPLLSSPRRDQRLRGTPDTYGLAKTVSPVPGRRAISETPELRPPLSHPLVCISALGSPDLLRPSAHETPARLPVTSASDGRTSSSCFTSETYKKSPSSRFTFRPPRRRGSLQTGA